MRIQLVDDEPYLLKAMQRDLRARGDWEVHTFATAADALNGLLEHAYDVIISDYKMPDYDGICYLQWARQIQPDAQRILMTAWANEHVLADAINKANIHRYIGKPISSQALVSLLDECARQLGFASMKRIELGLPA